MIRADVELLDKLPAGHPSREALTGHIEMLVYKLVRRERRQAQPFTETGVTFGVTAAIAGIFLLGAIVGALEAVGWYTSEPDPETREYAWMEWASPLVIGLVCAWFALRAWRRGTQEHEFA